MLQQLDDEHDAQMLQQAELDAMYEAEMHAMYEAETNGTGGEDEDREGEAAERALEAERVMMNEGLMSVVSAGNPVAVALLLRHRANAESINPYGQTPLLVAASVGHEQVVDVLLKSFQNSVAE